MNSRIKALKRILSDLRENAEYPIDGAQVYLFNEDEDLFALHCDIRIMSGVYSDITIHTIIRFPETYPFVGPAMNIAEDFRFFNSDYHAHVLGTSICNDMLSNFQAHFDISKTKNAQASGWSSGYTLNVVLTQMQVFFANPDLIIQQSRANIETLKALANAYKCPGCSEKKKFKWEPTKPDQSNLTIVDAKKEFKLNLICGISKINLHDNPSMIVGYPLLVEVDKFNRLWPKIVLEYLSYDSYANQIQQEGVDKLDRFEKTRMFSANGSQYNYWIPVFISEEHFALGYVHVKNAISVIRYGIRGTQKNDFQESMVLEVMPCLMNKLICHMMEGTVFHSKAAIQAYCHILNLSKFIRF
jgi:ubiquitin-protein ligase